MKVLKAWLIRTGLSLGFAATLWALGMHHWFAFALAILLSAMASYVLLPRVNAGAAAELEAILKRRPQPGDQDHADEDAEVEGR